MSQCSDEGHGDSGWVRSVTPHTLEHFKSGLKRLTLYDVDIPLDDVSQYRSGGRQRNLQVLQGLLSLRSTVTFPKDRT